MDGRAEWLEPDGLGGFASGTVLGIRTRRYHALLLHARRPPSERMVLVNGFDAWVEMPGGRVPITTQSYAPDVLHPQGTERIESFSEEPWPRWSFRLDDGLSLEQELFVVGGASAVALGWRLSGAAAFTSGCVLCVRPFLSGRDYHALHHENDAFRFAPRERPAGLVWSPYEGVPAIHSRSNGRYVHAPLWYRQFAYDEERARGLDWTEDLASPGILRFDLGRGEASWLLAAEGHEAVLGPSQEDPQQARLRLRKAELARRADFPDPMVRAADAYVVRRGRGRTLVAGYPWFTDWGRDTFIALRGIALATGRLDLARDVLLEWSDAVQDGMLPNRFPDRGEMPEFNAVDASLWYVVAVREYLDALNGSGAPEDRRRLQKAVQAILEGYAKGTRHGIRLESDGLLAAGEPGAQLTWMDARVGDHVVTPRIGKPVEVQALWVNALRLGGAGHPDWEPIAEHATASFRERFWDEERGHLRDVVDVDHRAGEVDPTFRPNQILAVGGLPRPLIEGERARRVVDAVEARLWTPLGLRTLAPGEPGYTPHYEGGVAERDGAYHQGTAWPWLLGPFVEAWVRVRGGSPEVRREARRRFLEPVFRHLGEAGLGHVSEIADAEPPHTPRGCPFQAWSLGEFLRLDRAVLAEDLPRHGIWPAGR